MKIETITAETAYDHERRVNSFIERVGQANIILPITHFTNVVETERHGEEKEEIHYTTIITYRG